MADAAAAVPSFAQMLASLAAPATLAGNAHAWSDDGLADDVAVLSREGAERSRESAVCVPSQEQRHPAGQPVPPRKPPLAERDLHWENSRTPAKSHRLTISEVGSSGLAPAAKSFKRASITIRVSAAECAQLRARAAESGLTLSAYLRSCTLEAESLRAQVKSALAQLRAPAAENPPGSIEKPSLFGRVAQIWPRRGEQKAANA
jgi:predicted DNA binding CopG/RHH family protein